MPGTQLTVDEKARIDRMRAQGARLVEIEKALGRSYRTIKAYVNEVERDNGKAYAAKREEDRLPDVKRLQDLTPDARAAMETFSVCRRRHFGRVTHRWNDVAADRICELLESSKKEYVVVNVPPGVGKTTTFTHDLPAWLTVRNRAIRGLLGHRAEREAAKYTNRLRRTLDRKLPYLPDDNLIQKGLAVAAASTLIEDYGRFRPANTEVWRAEEFVVAQVGDVLVAEKEMTWSAYGMDSAQIGNRFEFIDWDDLVTRSTIRTVEAIANQQEWWTDEAETRLEPGGLLMLVGQRLGPNDLYRFALDMAAGDDDDFDEEVGDVHELDMEAIAAEEPKKYVHIKFQAHDDARCQELKARGVNPHRRDAPAQPEGCLLDPLRLPWRELSAKQKANDGKYQIVYQQEDVDPTGVLVPSLWVHGGVQDGVEYLGCWDDNRGWCELPKGLDRPLISVVTADPSVANYWAFQWWVVQPSTNQRFLMDCVKARMSAELLLDWLLDERKFTGLMEDWQLRSMALGVPITHWVIEKVAAFKFLLVYRFAKQWMRERSVHVLAHETGNNKNHRDLGISSVQPHWKYGRVRLPGGDQQGRLAAMKLVEEVTRYRMDGTASGSDDQVLANWFLEWNLPTLMNAQPRPPLQLVRPDYLRSGYVRSA